MNLQRLLAPTSVAVVGANEKLGMSNNAVLPMLDAGLDVVLVNPTRDELYGRRCWPSLTDVGQPIDAVLSLVNAERSIGVMHEAVELGCGGVAVAAAGFAELGAVGESLQQQLVDAAAAGGLAVIGPNCSGFKNVGLGVNCFTGGRIDLRTGGVSVVSQSGFLVRSAMAAGAQRGLGFSIAVSSGNEAVCDLADHLDALVDDEQTSVICLVIEKVRRPDAFFAAVARARQHHKPVIALKLGRSDRSRRIVQSHTGAIADPSWVYEVGFAAHGVLSARDIDDLLDQAQLFAQLPRQRWRTVESIGVITTSGGVAALAADLADDEHAPVLPLDELAPWVRERVPGDTVNPLDLTGFVMSRADLMEELFERYAAAVDVLVLTWWAAEGDEGWSRTMLEPFGAVARRVDTPFVVSPLEATSIGAWTSTVAATSGMAFTRGIQSTYRALRAMDRVVRVPEVQAPKVERPQPLDGPIPVTLVPSTAGPMVSFDAALQLLADVGVRVAGRQLVGGNGPHVVKLADVPHRAVIGAVRVGVSADEVDRVIAEMREIAGRHGLPDDVVVQPMVAGTDELFIGLHGYTELGAVILFGRGGGQVESRGAVSGRLLPIDRTEARRLAAEVTVTDPSEVVVDALMAVVELWRRHGSWIDTLDINPLIVTSDGLVAVDALVIARS